MSGDDVDDLLRCCEEYTHEQFEADLVRLRAVIATKHGIDEAEVERLIQEHRYEHSFDDPEDEYIGVMAMGRAAGWVDIG